MKQNPTIRDIAAAAGVHFTTVSLALRNDPRISAQTRDRVRIVAERINYRPNPLVTALMANVRSGRHAQQQLTLGFCMHWESIEGCWKIPTHRLFFEGAQARAETMGYRLTAFNLNETGISPQRWNRIFEARGIRGIILGCFQTLIHEIPLNWPEFCAVRIDPNPRNPHLDTACTNQNQVVRVAFRQARARQYKRIALAVHKFWDERLGDAFHAGYLTEQAEIPVKERIPAFRTYTWTQDAFNQWFKKARPDCIIGMDEVNVRGWLKALGVKVPGDVAFADLDQKDTTGRVAGMRKHHTLLGATAVDMVIKKLQHNERGIPEYPKITLIAGKWIEGTSMRPLPPGTPDPTAFIG